MGAPYEPDLRWLCDDMDCCLNGCPVVTCRTCGQEWPCLDYVESHSDSQVRRQIRWVARHHYPNDPDMVKYEENQWRRTVGVA